MEKRSQSEIISFYVQCIEGLRAHHQLQQAVYVGHSYGAYLTIYYARAYTNYVSHLYLLDTAGIFPLLGEYGAYWGVFFKLRIPYLLCRYGCFARYTTATLVNAFLSDSYIYPTLIYTSKNIWGDVGLSKFISLTMSKCFWNTPAFSALCSLKCPVTLVYGEEDNIMPCHQGEQIAKQLHVQLYVVKNCGHSPLSEGDIDVFVKFLIENRVRTIPYCVESIPRNKVNQFMQSWVSYFELGMTNKALQDFYSGLDRICSHSSTSSLDPLK